MKSSRFLGLWAVAILACAAAFIGHLAIRFETVRLGYDVGHARREQRQLLEQRRLLSVEAATLRQVDRVELTARRDLGMRMPTEDEVVGMGKNNSHARGRLR